MRLLGIDYGTKRVGLALSDEDGLMAFPLTVIDNNKDLLEQITALVDEKIVEAIVLGHSKDNQGQDNAVHTKVEELINDLTLALGIPIHLEPEQYSTQEAIRFQGRTPQTDAAAAAVILNSFITRNK